MKLALSPSPEGALTQVALAGDDRVAVGAVELGHVLRVLLQDVHLHGAALGEAGVADVALVRLLPWEGGGDQEGERAFRKQGEESAFQPPPAKIQPRLSAKTCPGFPSPE